MTRKQWVNLPREAEFVRDGIPSVAHLGPNVVVHGSVDRAAAGNVTVHIEPHAENATWSSHELDPTEGRPNVVGTEAIEQTVATDADGNFVVSFRVSQAGGDRYAVRVTDARGGERTLEPVETVRRLYYRVMRMEGAAAVDMAPIRRAFMAGRSALELIPIASDGSISRRDLVPAREPDTEDGSPTIQQQVIDEALAGFGHGGNNRNYVCILLAQQVGLTGRADLVVRRVRPRGEWTNVNLRSKLRIASIQHQLYAYWDEENPNQWFGEGSHHGREITRDDVRVVDAHQISIRSDALHPSGGNLELRNVWYVLGKAGFSESSSNVVAVSTKSANSGVTIPEEIVRSIVIHEVGHKVGLVPGPGDSSFNFLTRSAHQYGEVNGSHCGNPNRTEPTCAMFEGVTRTIHAESLCSECVDSLRRSDLRAEFLARAGGGT